MNINELAVQMRGVLPNAAFDIDNNGQVIVYTNLRLLDDGGVVEFEDVK